SWKPASRLFEESLPRNSLRQPDAFAGNFHGRAFASWAAASMDDRRSVAPCARHSIGGRAA
ncbi:hypothetical protein T440DRAFT_407132, partial [Plenodomus tracheiphilus IPT5]